MTDQLEPARPLSAAFLPGVTSGVSALLAASCCIIPILFIVAGLAGAGFMMSMMRYEWLTLPMGTLGLLVGWGLYFRQRRRCRTEACQLVGRTTSVGLLVVSTLIVSLALLLRIFPAWTASIFQSIGG